MIHTERDFKKICIAVVLSNSSPCMPGSIGTIVIFLGHIHILADFLYTVVYVSTETIRITVSCVEAEQILVIFRREIFIEHGLNKRLYTHLKVCFICSAVSGLSSLITDNTISVVGLFQVKQIDCINASHTENKFCNIAAKFRK